MPSTDTETRYTPMEEPAWMGDVPQEYWGNLNDPVWSSMTNSNLPSYLYYPAAGWGDIRNAYTNYADQQEALKDPLMSEYWKKAHDAAQNYRDMYSAVRGGQSLAPEYSANGDFMNNFMGMVASPSDYSSFMADDDYYSNLAKELLGNKITIGYGDQSMSFLPGKTAAAYADILKGMMDTKSQAGRSYAAEKVGALSAYPSLVSNLTAAEANAANNLGNWTDQTYNYAMTPAMMDYSLSLQPYQTMLSAATEYPAGSWYNQGMQDYYNMWSPFEMARYYMPSSSSSTDYNRDWLDTLSGITGVLGGANALGVPSMLGNTLSGIMSMFGGGGGYTAPASSYYDLGSSALNGGMNLASGLLGFGDSGTNLLSGISFA